MIESFKDGQTGTLAQFYLHGRRDRSIPVSIEKALARKLDIIENASDEKALTAPPGNRYERLSGKLHGWSSVRVNIQWRLIFRWQNGMAHDVYLDPHSTY